MKKAYERKTSFRLSDGTLASIKAMSDILGVSDSEVIRRSILLMQRAMDQDYSEAKK